MKKILSALLILAMLCVNLAIPAMAEVAETTEYSEEKVYFYSDFSSPSDIGTLVENTAADIKPEIKTSSDGKSVLSFTKGSTVSGYQYASFNVVGSSSAPIKVENTPELVVEYKARLASAGTYTHFGTGSAYLPTATLRHKKIVYNQYNTEEVTVLKTFESNDWVKITTVYSNTEATRDVYINDVFIKTISATDDNHQNITTGNPYYTKGCKNFYVPFAIYANNGNSAEIDYLKVYAKTESFMAKIKDNDNSSVFGVDVVFNSPVKDADIKAANFKFTDGTNTIAASEIKQTGDNTYKVIPATQLMPGKDYTLSISIASDAFGTTLSTKALTFKTSSEVEFVDGEELYYNTFDSELGFSRTIEVANEIVYGLDTTDDGISIFKAQGTDVYQNGANYGFVSPRISADSGYNEVVLEYKLRVNADNPDSYMGTWSAVSNGWTKALDLARGENTKDKLYFHYNDKAPIQGDYTFNPKEWNTITIVYPKDRQSRDIYVNGQFIATSAEGEAENTYASKGFMHYVMLPDFRCSDDLLEVDYYKFTNKTPLFDASLVNADSSSIFVKFNTTPSNISADAFTLSDGTLISEIKAIDERTYMLIPASELTSGSYTLSFNGLKDTLGRAIERDSLKFDIDNFGSAEEFVYKFDGFTADPDYSELRTNTTITKVTNSEGLDVMKFSNDTGKGDNNGCSKDVMVWSDSERPEKYVIEYKVKINSNSTAAYFRTRSASFDGVEIKKNQIATYPNYYATVQMNGFNEWKTVSMVFDTAAGVNTRDIYINGDLLAKSVPNAINYKDAKSVTVFLQAYMQAAGNNAELDYVKIYTPADKFTAKVESVSDDLKTVYLDFNGTVSNISADMINVGGQQPASVELYDEEEQIYAVTLENKLKSNTDYTLSVIGAKSLIGKECYDVLNFKTRAAKEYDVNVTENIENAGTIEVNGVEGLTGKALEDSEITVTVRPFINYTATVTVDGKDIFKDRFDNFIIRNIKADTNVEVTYTEVTDETVVEETIETIPSYYLDKISSYTIGVLRRTSADFGVIAASSKANLTFEAVEAGNAYKFEAESTNKYGEYGIRLIDVSKKLGSSYYVIPYAVYGDTVVYGTAHSIKR